jgi:hypothetical protein
MLGRQARAGSEGAWQCKLKCVRARLVESGEGVRHAFEGHRGARLWQMCESSHAGPRWSAPRSVCFLLFCGAKHCGFAVLFPAPYHEHGEQ